MAGMLAGCNAKEGSDKKSSPSQVAVKVNKEEISVHQVNDLLARSSGNANFSPEQAAKVRSSVVERLIDQELLLEQAKNSKLDRNPAVMQMIDFARREILARAYGEQVMGNVLQPTETQINKFYDDNPELFSKRRIYNLQEIGIQVAPERFDEVRARVEGANGNLQQVMAWFSEQKIPVAVNAGIKPAEQIPLAILKNLAQMKIEEGKGGVALARTPMGAALVIVTAARDEPVDRATAKPVIQRILLNQARGESLGAEIKRLRGMASINYGEGFAAPSAEQPPAAEQAPATQPDAAPEDSIHSILEKGAVKLK